MREFRGAIFGVGLAAAAGVVFANVSGAEPAPAHLASIRVSAGARLDVASGTPDVAAGKPVVSVDPGPWPDPAPAPDPVEPPLVDAMTRPLIDIEGCVATGAYETTSPIPTDIVALYVDPANAGGPAAALRGDPAVAAVVEPRIEAAATGATYSVWDTGSGPPLVLGAKRMPEGDVTMLSASVGGADVVLPAGLAGVEPVFSGAKVFGSACERGGEFYAVEVVVGSLADRTWWLLNTDPVASSDAGDVTVARYSSVGVTDFPVRQASEAEWAVIGEQVAAAESAVSATGGVSG